MILINRMSRSPASAAKASRPRRSDCCFSDLAGDAEAAARQALQLDPYLYPARLTLAAALAGQGQQDEARRAVTALRASPVDPALRREVENPASKVGLAPARKR
jgi:hypothetical protein